MRDALEKSEEWLHAAAHLAMSTVYSAALKRDVASNKKRGAEDAEDDSQKIRRNKQRVLVLPSRGVTTRMRHLVNDLEALLPHAKKGMSHISLQTPSSIRSRICRS